MRPSEKATQYVVTLVHGTFARGAAWTHSDSAFCTALRNQLSLLLGAANPNEDDKSLPRVAEAIVTTDLSVVFDRFDWSGTNTHEARVTAGLELAEHLCRIQRRVPGSQHIIIGHSHAGNVALYAMNNEAVRESTAGIVCIATPFLFCKPRNFKKTLAWIHLLLTFAVLFACFGIGPVFNLLPKGALFHSSLSGRTYPTPLGILMMMPYMAVFFGLIKLSTWFQENGEEYLATIQRRVSTALSLPTSLPPMLCLYVRLDEPLWWLRSVSVAPSVAFRFWHSWFYFVLAGVASRVVFPKFLSAHASTSYPEWWIAFVAAVYTAVCIIPAIIVLVALHALIIAALCVVFRSRHFSYGETLEETLACDIEVRVRPSSAVEAKRYRSWKPMLLGHSLYDYDGVPADVAAWIKQQIDRRR